MSNLYSARPRVCQDKSATTLLQERDTSAVGPIFGFDAAHEIAALLVISFELATKTRLIREAQFRGQRSSVRGVVVRFTLYRVRRTRRRCSSRKDPMGQCTAGYL